MGEELTNPWLAEHVLKWRPISGYDAIAEETGGVEHMPPVSICHLKRVWFAGHGEQMACDECGDLPDFLGSITDAMQVWRKMPLPRKLVSEDTGGMIHGAVIGIPGKMEIGLAREDECLAICRAAQAWVLAQQEEDTA